MPDNKCQSYAHINSEQMQNLLQCMAVCKSCVAQCVQEGCKKSAALCNECAEACYLAIKFKCCNSEFCTQALKLCGEICKKCADECKKLQPQPCKECAEICARCCKSCCCDC